MHNDDSSFSELAELVGVWAGRISGIVFFIAVVLWIKKDWEDWAKLPLVQRRRYNRFTRTLGAIFIPLGLFTLVWSRLDKAATERQGGRQQVEQQSGAEENARWVGSASFVPAPAAIGYSSCYRCASEVDAALARVLAK